MTSRARGREQTDGAPHRPGRSLSAERFSRIRGGRHLEHQSSAVTSVSRDRARHDSVSSQAGESPERREAEQQLARLGDRDRQCVVMASRDGAGRAACGAVHGCGGCQLAKVVGAPTDDLRGARLNRAAVKAATRDDGGRHAGRAVHGRGPCRPTGPLALALSRRKVQMSGLLQSRNVHSPFQSVTVRSLSEEFIAARRGPTAGESGFADRQRRSRDQTQRGAGADLQPRDLRCARDVHHNRCALRQAHVVGRSASVKSGTTCGYEFAAGLKLALPPAPIHVTIVSARASLLATKPTIARAPACPIQRRDRRASTRRSSPRRPQRTDSVHDRRGRVEILRATIVEAHVPRETPARGDDARLLKPGCALRLPVALQLSLESDA